MGDPVFKTPKGEYYVQRGGQNYKVGDNDQEFGIVKAMAEGRMALPASAALRNPKWGKIIGQVSQYDPTFDAANQSTRVATRRDFTSGKSAQNVTSLNTAIGHLGRLKDVSEKLGGTDFPEINKVSNWFKGHVENDSTPVQFDQTKHALAEELTKAFRGTGGSESDIQAWEASFDASHTPHQRTAAIKNAVDLLHSRLDAVGDAYQRGMGKSVDPMRFLSPHSIDTLKAVEGAEPSPPKDGPQPSGLKPGTVESGYRFKGGNPADQHAWEKVQ